MLAAAQKLWQKRKIWIIAVFVQICLNLLAMALGPFVQKVCMFTSGALFLALSGYTIYVQRRSMVKTCLNIMLFYFNYSVVFAVYWNPGNLPEIFKGYDFSEFLYCACVLLLFYLAYTVFLNEEKTEDKTIFLRKGKPGTWVVAACTAYIALAPFLFYKTEVFGTRGVITSFYEYSLIVMIVAMRFTGRDIKHVAPLLCASGWIILHGLLHGERILALQMIIAWGLYLMLQWLSIKLVVIGTLCGVFGFTVFGIFRGANTMSGGNVFGATLKSLLSSGMANDTSYYAYLASLSISRLTNAMPIWERILYLLRYLAYVFAGSAVSDAQVSALAAEYNHHYGGGWLPFYADFWLSWPGVILIGVALAWVIDNFALFKKKHMLARYLGLYIVATSPRWYLYTPVSLTRGVLMFCLFYCLCVVGNNVLNMVIQMFDKKERIKRKQADEDD